MTRVSSPAVQVAGMPSILVLVPHCTLNLVIRPINVMYYGARLDISVTTKKKNTDLIIAKIKYIFVIW